MNEQVIEFLKGTPNSNKVAITAATGIKGLPLFNLLKKMLGDGQISAQGEGQETTYSISEAAGIEPATEEQHVIDETPQSQVDTDVKTGTGEQNEQTEQPGAEVNEEVKEAQPGANVGDEKKDEPVIEKTITKGTTSRDNSKFTFNGVELGKGPLVRAVVAKYVEDHPETTYKQLKEIFADTLMKRFGVFACETEAKKLSGNKPRYFLKPEQMIKIKGQKEPIAICNQWTAALTEPFIKAAKELGYKIE